MASKTLSTALLDKDGTYNRLRKAKANDSGEQDPLNRTGHVMRGLRECTSPRTPLSSDGSCQKKSRALLYLTTYIAIYDAALASTEL